MALPTQAVLTAAVAASDELSPKTRPSRTRKGAKQNKFPCFIVRQATGSLVLGFSLNAKILQRILAARPKQKQKTSRARPRKKILAPPLQEQEPPHYPAIPSTFGTPLLWVERDDESKSKPYGGILADAEADNHIGKPTGEDRTLFEDTRLLAEQSWKEKVAAQTANLDKTKTPRKMSSTGSKLECVSFGGFEIDIWHAAPYPAEYSRNRILYICEFCLKYMNSDYVAWRHKLKCQATQPPGQEIYHDGTYSFFEVDGRKNPGYCQNLCLLAKLFLGSKTLYYDVEPFLFYVMTENDEQGCHFVGYFSKEKRPSSLNNVSCILVLPIYQRRGFGHMLIDFSYLLTKREQKTGSPEKPLSDMGLISYRNYWRLVLSYLLKDYRNPISINEISKKTGMTADDIVSALEGLRALVMDPHTKVYALRIDHEYMKGFIEKHEAKGYPKIDPNYLIWTPFVMHRDLAMHYEEGGQLHTVAQREDLVEDGDGIKVENGVSIDQPAFSAQPSIDSEAMAYGTPELPNGHSPQPLQTPSLLPDWTERNGRSHTGTPYPGQDIPPTRFEVFPPIPGASKRKGPGRPYGSRGRPSTGRGGRVSGINKVTPAHVNGTTPRTSSRGRAKSTPMTATRRTRNSHRESEINGTMEDVTGKSAEKSAGVDGAGDAMEE
ncbi:hypothetical protein EJ06DRAFT_476354 [Trichodelitschia bisporula]|uniref:Histone acetyltransferase n=1 Tax=Trichodelitschia bisporula TaxID=703511 RepID=A0A6G1HXK4_9PEZI|nr:hypothetical protein EJ06DRAFT_476354 [Trichodelitschia bisporula]